MTKSAARRGFSLIEVALVFLAVTILTLGALQTCRPWPRKARQVVSAVERRKAVSAQALYRFDHGGREAPSAESLRGSYILESTVGRTARPTGGAR